MAFQTGTITNSHELVDKIFGFLIGIGWQSISTLQTNADGDGYDFVFKSSSNGRDVYIRVAAGLSDASRVSSGDIQHPYSDGYTEYVNGLAYQYFPSGGTASQGLNELGVYGPVLYFSGGGNELEEINLWRTRSGDGNISRSMITTAFTPQTSQSLFDGRRFVYTGSDINGGEIIVDITDNSTTSAASFGATATSNGTYIRDSLDNEHIYMQTSSSIQKSKWIRYNATDDTWLPVETIDGPPWVSVSGNQRGFNVIAMQRNRTQIEDLGDPVDFYRLIIAAEGFEETTMALFNTDQQTWSSILTPAPPFNLGHTVNTGSPEGLIVTKEMSGYEYDRLYIFQSANLSGFASIALGDDGYFQLGAPWVTHANTPQIQRNGLKAFFLDGSIYVSSGSSASDGTAIHKWPLPATPETSASWAQLSTWLPQDSGVSGIIFDLHNHLCNKVKLNEFQTNTYWLFADTEHLVVVVKNAFGSYSYMYMGLYEPFADQRFTTISNATVASATSMEVGEPDLFDVGKKYLIMDVTGASVSVTSNFSGASRNMAPSELFTVINKSGNSLVVSRLTRAYSAGSLVGEDPLPLTVRVRDAERAQTLNNISLSSGEEDFTDVAWQYYKLTPMVSDAFANTTDLEERSQQTFLSSIVLMDEGDTFTGKEVRGQLKNVFSVGVAVASEAEIAIGSKTYIAFDIDGSSETQRIVVGPK